MVKKIGDLTLREMIRICSEAKDCSECPLNDYHSWLYLKDKDLDKEVEVDE